jgi:uncharacterized protein YjbJ (UPF0337 family)
MNSDFIASKWKQLAGKAKAVWGELTDDELTRTEGNAERLVGLIQERYGRTKEQAQKKSMTSSIVNSLSVKEA